MESDIWCKPPLYVKVWCYLLMKAEYQDRGNLQRGQLFTSTQEIAEACSYYKGFQKITPTPKQVMNVIDFLRKPHEGVNEGDMNDPMIVTTKVTHGMLVTVCNYNKYQDPRSYERNNEGVNEGDMNGLRTGEQGNNIINEINKEKEKELFIKEDRESNFYLNQNHKGFTSIKAALMKGE